MEGGAVSVEKFKASKTAMADTSQMSHKATEQLTHKNQVAERSASRAKEDKDGKKDGISTQMGVIERALY